MPTSVGTSVLVLAAILATSSAAAAIILAAVVCLWEAAIFYKVGSDL